MKKLAVVGTFVAGVSVGFVTCGVVTVRAAINSEKVRKVIADNIVEYLLPEPRHRYNYSNTYGVSYKPYYYKSSKDHKCLFETREAAESVLNEMEELVSKCGFMSLQGFYDLSEMDMKSPSFETIGWKNIDDAKVMFTGRGYEIIMPETVELDA